MGVSPLQAVCGGVYTVYATISALHATCMTNTVCGIISSGLIHPRGSTRGQIYLYSKSQCSCCPLCPSSIVYHCVIYRTKVQCRYTSRRVPARGVFPGATVVRGRDWRWSDQDGGPGKEGTVLEISGWHNESSVSALLLNTAPYMYHLSLPFSLRGVWLW